jgi:hypothetical protein
LAGISIHLRIFSDLPTPPTHIHAPQKIRTQSTKSILGGPAEIGCRASSDLRSASGRSEARACCSIAAAIAAAKEYSRYTFEKIASLSKDEETPEIISRPATFSIKACHTLTHQRQIYCSGPKFNRRQTKLSTAWSEQTSYPH